MISIQLSDTAIWGEDMSSVWGYFCPIATDRYSDKSISTGLSHSVIPVYCKNHALKRKREEQLRSQKCRQGERGRSEFGRSRGSETLSPVADTKARVAVVGSHSLSRTRSPVTPRTVAHQAPPVRGFQARKLEWITISFLQGEAGLFSLPHLGAPEGPQVM